MKKLSAKTSSNLSVFLIPLCAFPDFLADPTEIVFITNKSAEKKKNVIKIDQRIFGIETIINHDPNVKWNLRSVINLILNASQPSEFGSEYFRIQKSIIFLLAF